VKQDGARSARITLAPENDVPNRDLVVDVSFQSIEPQVLAGRGKDGKGRFAAIVPSSSFGVRAEEPRLLVILLDKSGSMQGAPILQARKAIEACLGALSEADSFGLVAFNDQVQTFQSALVYGTRDLRDRAHQFLMQVEASGGTELATGFLEAAKLLQGGGGDIFILTDGQVSGTEKILADARAAGVRLHCLGIGSASQDRFLALLARETGGISRFVTPKERVDLPAVDLFNSVGRPVASGLKAGENVQPEPVSSVFSGTPVLLFGEADESAGTQIELSWTGGSLKLPVSFNGSDIAETLWLLQGSRLISDWESRYPSSEALAPIEKRKQSRVSSRLLELSQTYGLASREMSLVAVVSRSGDRAGELPETRVVPVGMTQDTLFEAYFGSPVMSVASARSVAAPVPDLTQFFGATVHSLDSLKIDANNENPRESRFARFMRRRPAALPSQSADDILLDLASRMDSDGGMPGRDNESRAIATVVALLAFLSQGHTAEEGVFRSHVARLVLFLKSLTGLSSHHRRTVDAVIEMARKGKAPAGEWIALAHTSGNHWRKVEQAC
jgi:Ca-activated chloride channel family protein